MSYSISKEDIINYPAQDLYQFHAYMFEWIDNLNFTLDPCDVLSDANSYIDTAKHLFSEMGWDGNGQIRLMWIPPFMFGSKCNIPSVGITIWHVKQQEDGLSWILSPTKLPIDL